MTDEHDKPLLKDWRVWSLIGLSLLIGLLIGMAVCGKLMHQPPAWGDIPTWLAVVAASAGGWIALSQLRDQQAVMKQDTEDRRKAQAARVFIGAPRDDSRMVAPYAQNASEFPVYEAELWYLDPHGQLAGEENSHKYLGTMLPKEATAGTRTLPSRVALRRTILTFRDANNVHWIRMPGGVLMEQSAAPTLGGIRAALRTLPPELGPRGSGAGRRNSGVEDSADGADCGGGGLV